MVIALCCTRQARTDTHTNGRTDATNYIISLASRSINIQMLLMQRIILVAQTTLKNVTRHWQWALTIYEHKTLTHKTTTNSESVIGIFHRCFILCLKSKIDLLGYTLKRGLRVKRNLPENLNVIGWAGNCFDTGRRQNPEVGSQTQSSMRKLTRRVHSSKYEKFEINIPPWVSSLCRSVIWRP